MVATQAFDLLVIESTGVSEPMPVAATFTTEDASGATLNKYFTIDNMVSGTLTPKLHASLLHTVACRKLPVTFLFSPTCVAGVSNM